MFGFAGSLARPVSAGAIPCSKAYAVKRRASLVHDSRPDIEPDTLHLVKEVCAAGPCSTVHRSERCQSAVIHTNATFNPGYGPIGETTGEDRESSVDKGSAFARYPSNIKKIDSFWRQGCLRLRFIRYRSVEQRHTVSTVYYTKKHMFVR